MLGYTRLVDMTKSPEERVLEQDKKGKKADTEKTTTPSATIQPSLYILNCADEAREYHPHTYEKVTNKYGLVICDIKRVRQFRFVDV